MDKQLGYNTSTIQADDSLYTEILPICCKHKDDEFQASICLVKWLKPFIKDPLFEKWLHPKELAYLRSLKFTPRQQSYALGRLAAKKALQAHFPEAKANALLLEAGVFDQPVLLGEGLSGVQVSISHKDNLAASIVYSEKHPMAIDIEKITPAQHSVVANILTIKEKELFFPGGDLVFDGDFYSMIWSVKETLGKVLKTGFSASMEIFEVSHIENTSQDFYLIYYSHFPQYKSFSFLWHGITISLLLPKESHVFGFSGVFKIPELHP